MEAGCILKQKLSTGIVQLWEVESFNHGGLGEISLVKIKSLSQKNTIENKPEVISIPSNMVYSMIESGILTSYSNEADCYKYAKLLAVSIWEKHYQVDCQIFKPLDTLSGVLSQIDNMTTGLIRKSNII